VGGVHARAAPAEDGSGQEGAARTPPGQERAEADERPGSLTPVKEAAIVSQIQQVVSIIKSSKRPDHELRMYFANGQNPLKKVIDPRIINIAFDVARKGGLSAPNVKAAHDLGIHVGGHFKRLAKQPKAQVQQGIFTSGPFGGTGLG
jgi:hypothetical protein